jgi:hypothetical protein
MRVKHRLVFDPSLFVPFVDGDRPVAPTLEIEDVTDRWATRFGNEHIAKSHPWF